ncbi:substrate-specific component CbiM of cobalt ECF transporter [Klebsiella michiganensis]|nr:substrate-specific component CbiM of cobalt ECF transporter [Klebsiella michiganensis]
MKLEQQLKQLSFSGLAAALLLIVVPEKAFAMHIMEGFLPPMWALAWWLAVFTLPVVRAGAPAPHRAGR